MLEGALLTSAADVCRFDVGVDVPGPDEPLLHRLDGGDRLFFGLDAFLLHSLDLLDLGLPDCHLVLCLRDFGACCDVTAGDSWLPADLASDVVVLVLMVVPCTGVVGMMVWLPCLWCRPCR